MKQTTTNITRSMILCMVFLMCGVVMLGCSNQLYSDPKEILPHIDTMMDDKALFQQELSDLEIITFMPKYSIPFDLTSTDPEDSHLHYGLVKLLKEEGYASLIQTEEIGICVVDLKQPNRYAGINMDTTFYAASFPKVLILLGAIQKAYEDPRLKLEGISDTLLRMITYSSNGAATQMGLRIGIEYINEVASRYHLYDREYKGGLWLGRLYAHSTKFIGHDPLTQQHTHAGTPRQASRFWLLARQGRYINKEWSNKLLTFTANPKINHKMVRGFNDVNVDVQIWRKSGTYNPWHVDSGIVKGKDSHYIVSYFLKHPRGEQIIRDLAPKVHTLMKYKQLY